MSQPVNTIVLVVSLSRNCLSALRVSLANNNQAPTQVWNQNDLIQPQIYFCNEIDNVLTPVGYLTGTDIGIGATFNNAGTLTTLFSCDGFTQFTDIGGNPYYEGAVIDLQQASIATWLNGASSASTFFDIQVADVGGGSATKRLTVCKPSLTIYTDEYNDGNSVATITNPPSFITAQGGQASFIQNRVGITAQVGGSANDLDSIVTASGTVPAVAGWIVRINDALGTLWRLDVGTGSDTNITNFKVKPADYSSGTPLVWTWIGSTVPQILNLYALTGLTGGGASNLDGLSTKNTFAVGTMAHLVGISGLNALSIWCLESSTATPIADQIVRPVDYDASTNAVQWILLQ